MSEDALNPDRATALSEHPITESEDAAWASIATPLSVNELIAFCNEDVERLLRINPFIEFIKWEEGADGGVRYSFQNSSQQRPFKLDLELQIEHRPDGLVIHYSNGLKRSTHFKLESAPIGSKLTIIENYNAPKGGEQGDGIDEVDRSLTLWAKDLQHYLIRWKRWRGIAPWRWYMRRVWQPMKPSGRRITYMLLWISLVEVALVALGVAIYLVEYY